MKYGKILKRAHKKALGGGLKAFAQQLASPRASVGTPEHAAGEWLLGKSRQMK